MIKIILCLIVCLSISFVSAQTRFIDGEIQQATKKINDQFVYSASEESKLRRKLEKKGVDIIEEQFLSENEDNIFISTSISKFKSLDEYKFYFTKEGIRERIATLNKEKEINNILGESNIDIDSQISYLKKMYFLK